MVSSLDSSSQSSLLGGLLGSSSEMNLSSGQVTKEEALAVLTSRKFLENFVEERQLLKILFPKSWDSENKKWVVDREDIPQNSDGFELLSSSLNISFDKSLISVEFIHGEKDIVAYILNDLIDEVNSFIRMQSIAASGKNINFLKNEIANTQLAGSQEMLYRLVETEIQSIMLANTRQDYAFKIIDPAVEPLHPAGPNRKLIVIIGTLVGFILTIFLVFILNFIQISRSR